jgi:hypothetical protein
MSTGPIILNSKAHIMDNTTQQARIDIEPCILALVRAGLYDPKFAPLTVMNIHENLNVNQNAVNNATSSNENNKKDKKMINCDYFNSSNICLSKSYFLILISIIMISLVIIIIFVVFK